MKIEFNLSIRDFSIAQFTIITCILILGIFRYLFSYLTGIENLFGFLRLIDVGEEQSIPTYFSSLNLLLSVFLVLIIYKSKKLIKLKESFYWLFLAFMLLILSIDESAGIHENFMYIQKSLSDRGSTFEQLAQYNWLPFGILFTVIFVIIFLPFIKSLSTELRVNFFLAGFIFILGAMGFEYLGLIMLKSGISHSRTDLLYEMRRVFEEGLEMSGIAIFNISLYREIYNNKLTVIANSSYDK